jgi:Tol biopolymer transport system component
LTANSKTYSWLSAANGRLYAVERDVYSSIYIADFPDGSLAAQTKQIFNEPGLIEEIDWPADDKIFYNSWATGKNEIWQINPDGTLAKQVTNDARLTYGFSVSPTDGRLVFAATRKRTSSLFVADADGQNVRQLSDGTEDFRPRFMPDGKEVVFQRGSLIKPTLWRVSSGSDQPPKQFTGYFALQPSVSPDGKLIAYQFMDFDGADRVWRLGLMDASSGKLLNKIDFPYLVSERRTVWRPGQYLVTMVASMGESFGFLLLSPVDNSHQTIEDVTTDNISSFVWSPDGKRLAFSSNQETSDAVIIAEP